MWLALLGNDEPVRDRFQLRDKTVVVRLNPYEVANQAELAAELDSFVDLVDLMSRQVEGISPANPINVWPDLHHQPRTFYGDAFLLGLGVEEPPDDDNWLDTADQSS